MLFGASLVVVDAGAHPYIGLYISSSSPYLSTAASTQVRIPRAEVEAIGAYVKAAVETLCGEYGLTFVAVVLVVGSYRRGAVDSGDVDILILPPEVLDQPSPAPPLPVFSPK